MEVQKVFFFSATGNSLYVASRITNNPLSIPQEMKKQTRDYSAEAIGIVCPVFYGEIPQYVQNFLKKSTFHTPYFYFVLTYGSTPTIAPHFATACAKKCGINVSLVATIFMVDNYLPYFDMKAEMAVDKHVDAQIESLLEVINRRKTGVPTPSPLDYELYEREAKFNKENPSFNDGHQITITDACVGCGTCTRVCPLGNCYLQDGTAHRKSQTCEFCMACIQNCPVNAIALSIEDKNPNARYRNKQVSVEEIEKANCQICQ